MPTPNQPLPDVIPVLHIDHNHGTCVLRDVELHPFSYRCDIAGRTYRGVHAEGTVVSGGETSRLFHATSHRAYEVGTRKRWTIYGNPEERIRKRDDGSYYANVQFCG